MRPSPRRGFTLLEIAVVIAIIMILTAIGIGMSENLIPRFRTRKAAMTFASLANECRALAIRTGRECSIWIISSDGSLSDPDSNVGEYWVGLGDAYRDSTTWDYLPPDSSSDGSDDDTSQGVVDLSDADGNYYARRVSIDYTSGSISGPGTGNSDRIVFNPRGWVENPSTDFDSSGNIEVTFVNKMARKEGLTEDFTVTISRAGMTRVDSTPAQEFSGLSSGTTESSSP